MTASIALMLVIASGAIAAPTNGAFCEEHCSYRAGRLFEQCGADGGELNDCDKRATLFLDSCLRDECGLDNQDPTCDRICSTQMDDAVDDCCEAGGLLELCTELVLTDFRDCVEKQCGIDLPDPPCPTRCRSDAERELSNCVENGDNWESCAHIALLDAEECIASECPPAPVCAGACTASVYQDGIGDAVFRPTDIGLKGRFDPEELGPLDLIYTRIGPWMPIEAATDAFDGEFALAGEFVRIDLAVRGLVNPPGPLGPTTFEPYRHGFRPLYGFVEIDVDSDADTGGEIEAPLFRYLGNVARFGGLPRLPRFFDRIAVDSTAFFRSFEDPPYLERHGEDFHIALLGNEVTNIQVLLGNADRDFDPGETWLIWGRYFHRAHGYEDFSFADGGSVPGEYDPVHPMLFKHDEAADVTWISVVFPLTQMGAAQLRDEPLGPINTNPSDQASIFEGLVDLRNSADFLAAFPSGLPEEAIIQGWAGKSPEDFLDPRRWSVTAIIGTSYVVPASSRAYFVWSDVYPNPILGDVDGSGFRGSFDAALVADWIAEHDLEDGILDRAAPIQLFAGFLSVLDINYDGIVDGGDILLSDGDVDHDGDADLRDFSLLQQCFGNGTVSLLCAANDFNRNDQIDEQDASLFRWSMRGPR